MGIEEAILKYLSEFGDTRESDLINYLISDYSDRHIKNAISKLEKKGIIHRIVHMKLKPPAVYYGIREHELKKGILEEIAEYFGISTEQLLHLFELGIIYGEDDF